MASMSFFFLFKARKNIQEKKKNATKQTFRDPDNLLASLPTNQGKAILKNKRTHMYPRSKTKMQIKLEQLWSTEAAGGPNTTVKIGI